MPYQIDNGSPLPAILGIMAAIKQGKQNRQDRDLSRQYQQAQIKDMQTNEQRTSDQDTLAKRKAGVGIDYPQQMAPQANADPLTSAQAYLHMADFYDSKGATDLAKQYRDNAAAIIGAYYGQARIANTNAQAGLNTARTATEQQRPGLVKAQTKATDALVPLRGAQTKRITTIQPQQFEEQQRNQMTRSQMAIAAAQERAANAQAAAWERLQAHLDHQDKELNQRENFTRSQTSQRNAHGDNSKRNTAQAEVLRTKVKGILKANPGASIDQIRDAARQDGYSDDVINLVLPKGKGEKNFKTTTAKGTSMGWGTP